MNLEEKIVTFVAGQASLPIGVALHETGHLGAVEALGGDASYHFDFQRFTVDYSNFNHTDLEYIAAILSAPMMEYAGALAFGLLGSISNGKTMIASKVASISLSSFPFIYSLTNFLFDKSLQGTKGDYRELDELGIPYFASIAVTGALMSAGIYLNHFGRALAKKSLAYSKTETSKT